MGKCGTQLWSTLVPATLNESVFVHRHFRNRAPSQTSNKDRVEKRDGGHKVCVWDSYTESTLSSSRPKPIFLETCAALV